MNADDAKWQQPSGEQHAFRTDRDLLLEFIQWSVDNPGLSEDIYDDPLAADVAISEFLEGVGVVPA